MTDSTTAPCPDGDNCPDARKHGDVHPAPTADTPSADETLTVEDTRAVMLEWAAVSVPDDGLDGVRLAVCLTDESCKAGDLPGVWEPQVFRLKPGGSGLMTEREYGTGLREHLNDAQDRLAALETESAKLRVSLAAAHAEHDISDALLADAKAQLKAAEKVVEKGRLVLADLNIIRSGSHRKLRVHIDTHREFAAAYEALDNAPKGEES